MNNFYNLNSTPYHTRLSYFIELNRLIKISSQFDFIFNFFTTKFCKKKIKFKCSLTGHELLKIWQSSLDSVFYLNATWLLSIAAEFTLFIGINTITLIFNLLLGLVCAPDINHIYIYIDFNVINYIASINYLHDVSDPHLGKQSISKRKFPKKTKHLEIYFASNKFFWVNLTWLREKTLIGYFTTISISDFWNWDLNPRGKRSKNVT